VTIKIVNGITIGLILLLILWGGLTLNKGRSPDVLSVNTDVTDSVNGRLTSLENRVAALERNAGLTKNKAAAKSQDYYVSLTGGTAGAPDWTKIPQSEFQLDTSLYGQNVEVSWQGWMDNGLGSARIYDKTNSRAVDNSEITVNSGERSSFFSKPLSIWRGVNEYYLQVKSVSGNVTISTPRLKVSVGGN
jgi:hypothetical protein